MAKISDDISSQDLFHQNPVAGFDLSSLYSMPTPNEQQQRMQMDAFMAQSPITNPMRNPFHFSQNSSNPFKTEAQSFGDPFDNNVSNKPTISASPLSPPTTGPEATVANNLVSDFFATSSPDIVKGSEDTKCELNDDKVDDGNVLKEKLEDEVTILDGEKKLKINEADGSVIRNAADDSDQFLQENQNAVHNAKGIISRLKGSSQSHQQLVTDTEEGRTERDIQRFMGEGLMFKAKLIGSLEVLEAIGDRMCQDALQQLKLNVKALGKHKQRIVINIGMDGLSIKDEKTGDCLYHHSIHKISFIAQDLSDARAFGYIFGSKENGHKFFAIKTEKASRQVTVAMRDLFQVLFKQKQMEIEEAKRQSEHQDPTQREPQVDVPVTIQEDARQAGNGVPPTVGEENETGALSDLLGLESGLSQIQDGTTKINHTPQGATPEDSSMDSAFQLESISSSLANVTHAPNSNLQQQQKQMFPQATVTPGPLPSKPDAFGSVPFLPPPPKTARQRSQEGFPSIPSSQQGLAISQQQQQHPFASLETSKQEVATSGISQDRLNEHKSSFDGLSGVFCQPNSNKQQEPTLSSQQQVPNTRQKVGSTDIFANLDPLAALGRQKATFGDKKFSQTHKSASMAEMAAATKTTLAVHLSAGMIGIEPMKPITPEKETSNVTYSSLLDGLF